MFLGSSLNPEYFKAKVNLFVALGPVTTLNNIRVPALKKLSSEWHEVEWTAYELGAWDLFGSNWREEEGIQIFCGIFLPLCEDIISAVADANTDVDNMDRLSVFLKDFPAGEGYQSIVYYAQNI